MEIVFRSSFLLALTCSKRICFPPDTDSFSFLRVKEWSWSIWGPVPGGAGSLRIREAGALGGGTPPPVRAAAGSFGACGAKASAPPSVYALPPYHGGPYLCTDQVPFAQKRGSSQPLSFTLVPYQRNTPPGTARPWCRYTAPWHGRCCSRPLRIPGRWDPVCGSLPAQTPSGSPPYP